MDERDLRRLACAIEARSGDKSIVRSLGRGSVSDMASELIELIEHRELERYLFEEWLHLRPRRFAKIRAVARQFAVRLPPPCLSNTNLASLGRSGTRRAKPGRRPNAPPPSPSWWLMAALIAAGFAVNALDDRVLAEALSNLGAVLTQKTESSPQPQEIAETHEPPTPPLIRADTRGSPAPQSSCARPEFHHAPSGEHVELFVASDDTPDTMTRMTFPADLDSGEVARHIALDHFLRVDDAQRARLGEAPSKLCTGGKCTGSGAPLSEFVRPARTLLKASVATPQPTKPAARTGSGERSRPSKSLSDKQGNATHGNWKGPDVTFILMEKFIYYRSAEPTAMLSCSGRDRPCARTTNLPTSAGRGEFTLSLALRLDAADPRTLSSSVTPYSDDCWWRGEQPILTDASGACGDTSRFALHVTAEGGLRWLLQDGADVGPGLAWSIEAPASGSRGLLDAQWHSVTLVRRFLDDGDARLELWLDGALQGVEISDSRIDLESLWMTPDGTLRAPWWWYLAGELGPMQVLERALTEHELEAIKFGLREAPEQAPAP